MKDFKKIILKMQKKIDYLTSLCGNEIMYRDIFDNMKNMYDKLYDENEKLKEKIKKLQK